jgi:TolA-binding protein
MSSPRRSGEHWNRFEFELLRSARGDAPAPGARKKVLVAFGAGGSGALAGSAGARAAVGAASKTAAPLASGAKFAFVGAGKWIALALLGAGALGTVGRISLGGPSEPQHADTRAGTVKDAPVVPSARSIPAAMTNRQVAPAVGPTATESRAPESHASSTPSAPPGGPSRAGITHARPPTAHAANRAGASETATTVPSFEVSGPNDAPIGAAQGPFSHVDESATPPHERPLDPDATTAVAPLLTPRAALTAASLGPDLAAEMASLDTARLALRTKQAELALRALDDYARAFPRGALAPEAMVLRIDALTSRGDRRDAAALAKVFLEAFPKSPLAPRVRAALVR